MSYLVLARKYRPQTLDDLVGQDHVARTLGNAIDTGRIAHAFLFTGVRGVGKTTSARVLAKCLNCVGPDGKRTTPTRSVCNQCSPCREIAAGQDLDVQEIDGASYNGVDEVRRLQEGVSFRPVRDRFKVYIVDEVHMLSSAAWNAFLKTLEEPPPHVKFIFATTEVHKVPITILSRCQRYDFKLIATQAIARRLEQVLSTEGIEADRGAVQVLAREAAGSMRDAMSLLDQVIAFSGATLSASDVVTVLGVPDRKILHDLASAFVGGRPAECLQIIERVAQQGLDLGHVAKDILAHLRNLVVAKVCAAGSNEMASLRDLLDLADEELRDIVSLASLADVDDLSRCFQGFSRAYDEIARSGQPRMALEMALVRLSRRPPLLAIDELLSRVAELERRIEGSSAPAARGGGGGGAGAGRGVAQLTTVSAGLPTTVEPPFGRTRGALALAPSSPNLAVAEPQSRAVEGASPLVVTLPLAPSSDPDAWRSVIERVRALRPPVASIYEMAVPVEVTAARVTLAFEPSASFLAARAAEPEALEVITQAVRAHFDRATVVVLQPTAAPAGSVKSVAQVNAENRLADREKARARVEGHPLVRAAVRLLDAEVRDVRLPTETE